MPRETLEIEVFDPRQVVPAATAPLVIAPSTRSGADILGHLRLRYRTATSAVTAVAVVALHALVLIPILSGMSGDDHPERFGTPHSIQALLINDQSATAIAASAIPPPHLKAIAITLSDPSVRKESSPGLAALYGRYLGQIHARIDRAWLRPREAIGSELFRCQADITQQRDGTVDTITLEGCNGTPRWWQSLVQGIEAASPLPAPPDPAVFASRVVLHFRAVAYRADQPAGEYEPARRESTEDKPLETMLSQIRALRRPAQGSKQRSVIELRIDGSHVEIDSQALNSGDQNHRR